MEDKGRKVEGYIIGIVLAAALVAYVIGVPFLFFDPYSFTTKVFGWIVGVLGTTSLFLVCLFELTRNRANFVTFLFLVLCVGAYSRLVWEILNYAGG